MFGIDRGIVYILRTFVRQVNRHISSIHKLLVKSTFPRHPISNITSIPISTKPTKIKHLTTFHIAKNHQNTFKIPSNPSKIRLQSNLIKNHKIFSKNLHKISKKSLYKFPFFLSKIKHFSILTKSKNTFPPNSHIYNVKNPNGEYISVTKNLLFFKWRKLYGNTRNMERYSRI